MTYAEFFQDAFSRSSGTAQSPYAYQCRLACGPDARPEQPESLAGGATCQSQLISIPTARGKSA